MPAGEAGGTPGAGRRVITLSAAESWRLLDSISLGRVVFTIHALPAIRPVNHLIADDAIIIRTHLGAAITAHAGQDGAVVCYEADDLDPVRHTGWSVIATGTARMLADPDAAAHYRELLEPWAEGDLDHVIIIRPQIITGLRLTT